MIDGVLVIDKPIGFTSHDVVSRVKKEIGAKKVGHLGTLDPDATGVLPLCINGATKQASLLAGGEKIYSFTLVLGKITDTDDSTGSVISEQKVEQEDIQKLKGIVDRFVGEIDQVPPQYSAKKINGRRLYKTARKGIKVNVEPSRVQVYELTIEDIDGDQINMKVRCGPGTYVRALCRDIGAEIGVGGHASNIRRLQSGRFTIDQAIGLAEVAAKWQDKLLEMRDA
jgi:tRNA pseudouridine55 synthase